MRSLLSPLILILLLLGSGCGRDGSGTADRGGAHFYPVPDTAFQTPPAPDSTLALLDTVRTAPFLQAFDTLKSRSFTFVTRTIQYAADGQPVARQARTVEVRPDAPLRIVHAADSGAFDAGWLSPFVTLDTTLTPTTPIGQHLITDDPAYLAARNRDAYRYVQHLDTLPGGRAVRVIDVLARPGLGDDQPLRRARLSVLPTSLQLVSLYLIRHRQDALFGEESHFFTRLQPGPDDAWIPDTTRFRSRLSFPILPPFHLEQASAYRDVE
ncbi:MAG: hypothetical protein GVY18_00435 [Bacteroidetes bacterium]|jgi:hypothetical protein|nr:hypothetical protein [Bacteroidota bacterium]